MNVQPNYCLMGGTKRSSVDIGGISEVTRPRISSSWRTLVDFGGTFWNRIHTHEVTGSSPAPPTKTNPVSGKAFRDSVTLPV